MHFSLQGERGGIGQKGEPGFIVSILTLTLHVVTIVFQFILPCVKLNP